MKPGINTLTTTLALASCLSLRADAPTASFNAQNTGALIAAADAQADEDQQKELLKEQKDLVKEQKEQVERARDAAERSQRKARQTVDMARSKIAMAEMDMAEPLELQSEDGFSFAVAGTGRGGVQPLIVRGADMPSNTVANVQEDLAVMSRILNKTLEREVGREARDSAMGIVLSALPGARRSQSIYLEGYGAVFLLSVKFPLVPPPAKEEEKPEKAVDSTWEQTKREMYGNRNMNVKIWNAPSGEANVEYDSEQVEGLKRELIEAMKNAANIRDLKSSEWVTVTVLGSRAGSANRVKHISTNPKGKPARTELYLADSTRPTARESTLTLRASKADIDAYAKGALDAEQFKKRVSIAAY